MADLNSPADQKAKISRANLIYDKPAETPVEGQPIGNGTMGSMVWTLSGSVEFQINRVDVFAVNKTHQGDKQYGISDYCGG